MRLCKKSICNKIPTGGPKGSFAQLEIEKDVLAGFTLVELLVVIAIITSLLSILMPGLRKAKSMAMRLKCAHNLKQIDIAVNLYLNANDNIFPCAEDPLPAGYWLWMGRGWRSCVVPLIRRFYSARRIASQKKNTNPPVTLTRWLSTTAPNR